MNCWYLTWDQEMGLWQIQSDNHPEEIILLSADELEEAKLNEIDFLCSAVHTGQIAEDMKSKLFKLIEEKVANEAAKASSSVES